MEPADVPILRSLASGIDQPQQVTIHNLRHPTEAIQLLQSVDLVVSERLHGSILAAALETPTVLLNYALKCEDFMSSLDGAITLVNPDETEGVLMSAALNELHSRTERQRALRASVEVLRKRLRASLTRLSAEVTY
jgi:polysaccharide pyruvyl transferase WcaK-like protein